MTWSIQLTLWALPPLLAVLLVVRDVSFLWPRRREFGTRALLVLCVAVGVWAALDMISAVSPSPGLKLLLTRVEYIPAAIAPVAWAWFGLVHAVRKKRLLGWPMVLLYAATTVVVGMALGTGSGSFLVVDGRLVDRGGSVGLLVAHGNGHWLAMAARVGGVVGGSWTASRFLARSPGAGRRSAFAGAAAFAALAPAVAQLVAAQGAEWVDLSSTGFAVGTALLVWGLMRPQILDLGPVDRELVLRELRDPLVVMDGRGRIVDVNRAARDDLGLEPYGDVPLALGTLWASGPVPDGTRPTRVLLGDDGEEPRTFEVTLTPLGDGTSSRSAMLLRDVTARERVQRELERANADLERLARTDALTRLANRRHFMEALESEMERSRRYRGPLSIVLFDLDHFKQVNDTHGHAAGDDVLREAAAAIRSVCRDVDLPARLGGEELAILLPETDKAGARILAERVRLGIQETTHHAPDGETFTVTASAGVATAMEETASGETLLQAADEALYRAKKAGRNRVATAP